MANQRRLTKQAHHAVKAAQQTSKVTLALADLDQDTRHGLAHEYGILTQIQDNFVRLEDSLKRKGLWLNEGAEGQQHGKKKAERSNERERR